jgi:hypothetical protein
MKKITCHIKEENKMFSKLPRVVKILGICFLISFAMGCQAAKVQGRFDSAEKAVSSLIAALRGDDVAVLKSILGPGAEEIISSGDKVADEYGRQKFLQFYDEQNRLVNESGNKVVLEIGKDNWPFPIPLVKDNGGWFFDTMSGKEEVINRRIGRNELDTIQTLLAIVDAEREYALMDYNNDGILEYAEKFRSDPGKKNGLYWESSESEEQSPLGPLVAKAREELYTLKGSEENPQPYHGYFFKILKKQGFNAPGGAFEYVVKGNMIGGFAVIAFPAQYGNSGVMTFMTNHDGLVYEKDLGLETERIAKEIDSFDPDKSWQEVDSSKKSK